MKRFLIYAIVLISSAKPMAFADCYVSPTGCDSNIGTVDQPLASVHMAKALVRKLRAEETIEQDSEVTVWLEEGFYELDQGLRLTEKDSNLRIKARNGAEVTILGGRRIPSSAFHRVTDTLTLSRLVDESVRENVVRIDLRELGIDDFGTITRYGHMMPATCAPLELFGNGEALPLARYPNDGDIELQTVVDPGSIPRTGDYSHRGGSFLYTDPRHSRWAGIDDVWVQGTFHYGYADDNISIASIDTDKRQVTLAGEHLYGLAGGAPYRKYFVYNLLEELDSPGEWYLDRDKGMLYVWPKYALKETTFTVSMIEEPIISLENASNVTIEGLNIEAGRGIGVYIEGGKGNTICKCTVRNVGTTGILMGMGARQTFPHITHDDYEGVPISRKVGSLQAHLYEDTTWDRNAGSDHNIDNCYVYGTGSGGIYLSGGSKRLLRPGNSRVNNCLIKDVNRRNKFLYAGINVDGCGNTVSHCEVCNSEFQGIYVRGNDHLFEYNYLHDLALNSDDTSAWYIGRDPSDRGNVIRYNYFENIGRSDRMVMGIYLDDGSCGVDVFGNVFFKTGSRGSVFSNGGHNVRVINNIFVESIGPAVEQNSIWYAISGKHREHFFGKPTKAESNTKTDDCETGMFTETSVGLYEHRLLELIDIRKPPYSERYPQLSDFMEFMEDGVTRVGMRPRDNILARNVFYRCAETLKLRAPYAQFSQQDNYTTEEDPGFVDLDKRVFALRSKSVVYKKLPDFQPIPFDSIGRLSPSTN